ncbi:MAG: hypothetical protein ACXWRE_12320 [Pseudobdellovibrionaceae bacterium]
MSKILTSALQEQFPAGTVTVSPSTAVLTADWTAAWAQLVAFIVAAEEYELMPLSIPRKTSRFSPCRDGITICFVIGSKTFFKRVPFP